VKSPRASTHDTKPWQDEVGGTFSDTKRLSTARLYVIMSAPVEN
jgi:hypothetical protein